MARAVAPGAACAAARVEFEIAVEPGLPPGVEQSWFQLLSSLDIADLQLRGATAGDKVQIRASAGNTPSYRVCAILTRRNQLLVPGHAFHVHDRGALAAWIDRLRGAGPQVAEAAGKLPFDLAPAMLAQARTELRRPLRAKTKGVLLSELIERVARTVEHPIQLAAADRRELARAGACDDELTGLSCGTALAAMLRPAGLAFAPTRDPQGQLAYRVFPPTSDAEIWPIGWPAEERRRELAPKLFEFLNVEVHDVSVADAVEAVRTRLDIPLLYDHNALARHGIDPAATPAALPAKRTSYSLALQRLLFQARLKVELRIDEAGRPFFWVTSIKPID